MRIAINIVLVLAIVGLSYLLYASIAEPIQFRTEWRDRETAVKKKLEKIRDAQVAYKSIKGTYASSFDSLALVLQSDSFELVAIEGDPNDPNAQVKRTVTYVNALDSMQRLGINLDSLRYVPFTDGIEFEVKADVLDEYQNAKNIPVVEVGVRIKDYMGKYGSKKYAMYDQSYDPNSFTKFGDLLKPSTNGNWRK